MKFFGSFLENYRDAMEPRFTAHVFLWFVPEYSDEPFDLEAKKEGDANYEVFNTRVAKKFPEGFFHRSQRL